MPGQKEHQLQTQICASVRQDGGYARRVVDKFALGVPDLFIGLPPFMPTIVEVKDLGQVGETFSRKIGITPKQTYELNLIDAAYRAEAARTRNPLAPKRHGSLTLVGWAVGRDRYLTALPPGAERLDRTADTFCVPRMTGGYYNVRMLLEYVGLLTVRHT